MNFLAIGGLIGLAISIVGYLILARHDSGRVHTFRSYFFNGWEMTERLVSVAQFSSSMSLATVVIALLQLAGIFGIALSWATITFCVGWLIFSAAIPAIRARTLPRDTIHSFIGRSYGSNAVRTIAAIATIAGFMGLFSTELFAADVVLRALGLPTELSTPLIAFFGAVTVAYAAMGGFRSVVRSDWSQTALLLIAIAAMAFLTYWAWTLHPGPSIAGRLTNKLTLPLSVALSLFFINVPYPFVDTQAWQRARAASSDRAAKVGTAKASILFVITWSTLIFMGIVVAGSLPQNADPFTALLDIAARMAAPVAFGLGLLLMPGLFAAMFSSADAFINSAAHVFSLDLTRLGESEETADVTAPARRHALALGAVGLGVCMLLRYLGFGIVDMVFAVSAGQIALVPAVLFALMGRARRAFRHAAIASIVTGFSLAWLNGLYSTTKPAALATMFPAVARLVPPDVYRSPIYALAGSVIVFTLIVGLNKLVSGRAPSESGS